MPVAVVLARDGGQYRILLEGVERVAVLRGKAKRETDRAVAGDRVRVDPATLTEPVIGIEAVEPRRTLLERRVPDGRGTRPIAANVDLVVVVTAVAEPAPIPQLIDRLLVVAEANEIPAMVVVNKVDLGSPDAVLAHLAAADYPLLQTSVKRGDGLVELRERLSGRESVLSGPSGAGKSSLLNALEPGLGLRVGAISSRIGRGTHTTVTAALVPFGQGGFVVDTPGFSEVGVWNIVPGTLAECFPEFRPVLGSCRFRDCLHRTEPGCAVRELAEQGRVPRARYESYRAILTELEEAPEEWE
jgi:ribosome biogenesis GTPase